MGQISITSPRESAVDFSYPYFMTRVGFTTKKPSPNPNVMAILGPYDKTMWIAIATLVPTFSVMFFLVSKFASENFVSNFNLLEAIVQVIELLVMQGMNDHNFWGKIWFKFKIITGIEKWPTAWKNKML